MSAPVAEASSVRQAEAGKQARLCGVQLGSYLCVYVCMCVLWMLWMGYGLWVVLLHAHAQHGLRHVGGEESRRYMKAVTVTPVPELERRNRGAVGMSAESLIGEASGFYETVQTVHETPLPPSGSSLGTSTIHVGTYTICASARLYL